VPCRDLINRIEYISPFHAGFAALAEALCAPVGQLLGEPAVLFKEKINFKMPGGDGFKPHQDSQAGWDAYADYFVSVMVTIDEATVENGCLQLVSGHHRRGLFRSWEPLTDDDMADMAFVPCPTSPGDVVFFDCYAPHASEPNRSDQTRRLYFATYNRASAGDHLARYYADKRNSFPPDIEREPGVEYVFRV
jgi:ectoine hydroxylase-related dioxygenase (phytanoyl-CoA dioxygenase family)